jgi:hypothetical protein
MQDLVYKCLNEKCNSIFHGVGKEGICCPVCAAYVVPISEFKDYHSRHIPSYNDLKKNDLRHRLGIIKVSSDLIRENPEQMLKVFRDILVTDIKIEYGEPHYILYYKGMSKHFDVVENGSEIPRYDVIINTDNGRFKCSFKRVDD